MTLLEDSAGFRMQLEADALFLRTLGNPIRLGIIKLLYKYNGDWVSTRDLKDSILGASMGAILRHLSELKAKDIVETKKGDRVAVSHAKLKSDIFQATVDASIYGIGGQHG